MALDVKRNPATRTEELTWYNAADTTPAAIGGWDGDILVILKHEESAIPAWYGDNGYEAIDGTSIHIDEVIEFALMPVTPNVELSGRSPQAGGPS